jgi:hypothetical protein
MPRTRSDASAYSLWGQASVSRGTSFGWVHGDRHEACHPHTSRFFPVLVLRLRRLNYEHPSFFFIRSYLLCLIRPAFGGSARGAHGAEVAIYPRGWIPPSVPECHLMTSHDARGGRDSTSGQRHARASKRPSPTSVTSMLGTMSLGSEALRPGPFPRLTSFGQVARNATRRGRLEGCRDRGRGRPDPGSRPKRQPFDRWAKDLTCWSPSPTPSYGPSSGPIGLCPAEGEPMPLLSSRQLRGRMRTAHSRL